MSRSSSRLCVVSVVLLELHEGIEVDLGNLYGNLRPIGKGGVYDMLGILICMSSLRIGRIFRFRSVGSMFASLTLVVTHTQGSSYSQHQDGRSINLDIRYRSIVQSVSTCAVRLTLLQFRRDI